MDILRRLREQALRGLQAKTQPRGLSQRITAPQTRNPLAPQVQKVRNYFDPTKSTNERPGFWSQNNAIAQFAAKPQNYRIPIANTFKATPRGGVGSFLSANAQNFALGAADEIANIPQRFLEGGNRFASIKRDDAWKDTPRVVGAAASVISPFVDTVTLGGGTVVKEFGKQAVKNVAKQGFKYAVKKGAAQGALYGMGYGGLYGAQEGDRADAGRITQSAVIGAGLGGLLGGVTGGVSSIPGLLKKTPTVEKQLRDNMGRWTAGQTPVKPKGMTTPQWEFQLKFNKKYNRNPYTPVWYDDIQKAASYEVEKKGAGLSIRDVSKDKNPLGGSRTDVQKNLSKALKGGANEPVSFGRLSPQKFSEINRRLRESGQKELQNPEVLFHPRVIEKLRNKRINLENLTPDQVADIAFSAVHNTKSRVIDSRHPQNKALFKIKGGKANTAYIGEHGGKGSGKSIYIKEIDSLVKDTVGGEGLPPSRIAAAPSISDVQSINSIVSQGGVKVKLRPDQATRKALQTEKRIEQSLSPSQRTELQLQEAQQSARLQGSSGGSSGNSPQKALSSSKYAYNINKNRVQLSPSQKETLETTVNAIKPELEQIRGKKLSNKEVERAAKSSDMLQKITTREETLAAEAATLRARQRLTELDKNIDSALRSGNVKQVEAQMKDLIDSIRVVSSNAADAGRKLQSLSISAGDESVRTQVLKAVTKTGADTDLILKAATGVDWNNANSVTTFYRKFIKPTVPEILDEFRYNNMLSSPKTHLRNAFSNVTQAYVTRPMTLVFEGRPVEASKYFTGAVKALPEAYEAFIKSFKGETLIEKPDLERMIPTQKLPRFLTIPTRALEAGDRFFTTIIKSGELARGASKESAEAMAEYSLFRQGLNPAGQGPLLNAIDSITAWTYKSPKAVRWFVPFIRTPMNFTKQWIEYSPAGIGTIIGAGNKREQLAKAMIGSTVATFGGMLAAQGRTTWATPTDPKEKELFYAAGRKPFSIQIGDKWVPMMYAGPFAMALALPAAFKYYQEDSRTALSDSQVEKATQTVAAMAEFLSGQTFLGGIGNFVKWASGDVDYTLPKNLAFTAGQLVPMQGLVRYINTIVDPIYRKPKGFIESFQSGIPGLSQGLEAYTLPTGEESRREPLNNVLPFDLGFIKPEYEPLLQSRGSQLQQNSVENRAKKELETSGGKTAVAGSKILYTDETGSVKTIDLSPFDKVPTTALARAKQEQKKWDVAGDVYDSTLPDEEKNNIISNLGLDPADVEYYDFASQENDIKSMVIREELSGMTNREQLLQKLVEFRREVNGKMVLAPGVIDDLEDEGIISDAEAKHLKKIEYGKDGTPKVKVSGRGKGAKLKGVKWTDVKNVMGVPKINTKIDKVDTKLFSPQFSAPDLDFKVPSLGVGGAGTIPQLPNFRIKFDL